MCVKMAANTNFKLASTIIACKTLWNGVEQSKVKQSGRVLVGIVQLVYFSQYSQYSFVYFSQYSQYSLVSIVSIVEYSLISIVSIVQQSIVSIVQLVQYSQYSQYVRKNCCKYEFQTGQYYYTMQNFVEWLVQFSIVQYSIVQLVQLVQLVYRRFHTNSPPPEKQNCS